MVSYCRVCLVFVAAFYVSVGFNVFYTVYDSVLYLAGMLTGADVPWQAEITPTRKWKKTLGTECSGQTGILHIFILLFETMAMFNTNIQHCYIIDTTNTWIFSAANVSLWKPSFKTWHPATSFGGFMCQAGLPRVAWPLSLVMTLDDSQAC